MLPTHHASRITHHASPSNSNAAAGIYEMASKKFWGVLARRERWGLTRRGWLLVGSVLVLLGCFLFFGIHPFLAVTDRSDTKVLVVEGWVHDYAARSGAEEFKKNAYQTIYTTGGPVVGSGGYINDQNTSASVGADLLKRAGVPAEAVQMVPSHVMGRDRTYSSAVALREWFSEHNLSVRSVNVVTEDAHARRTRLLFQKALGKDVQVGIISVPNPDYDAKHWWRYSEGVREVIGETVAYLYARIFFHP